MAIVAEVFTDTVPVPQSWAMPEGPVALRSPVPRGTVTFAASNAIALLAAGSQINYSLTLTMPDGFAYLPRIFLFRYNSDDADETWDADGVCEMRRTSFGDSTFGSAGNTTFQMHSPGAYTRAAAVKVRQWTPAEGSPKLIVQGGDEINFQFSNMDAGAGGQVAGDFIHWLDFYVFDTDQITNWEVNTPIPVISHTAF